VGLAEDLSALFELHKSGGLSADEFQEIKSRMIKSNPNEVAKIAKQSALNKSALSPLQVGLIAASASIGTRMVLDHLKSDRILQDQVEKLNSRVEELEEFKSAEEQNENTSSDLDDTGDSGDFDY
jgi:hypothetical protein